MTTFDVRFFTKNFLDALNAPYTSAALDRLCKNLIFCANVREQLSYSIESQIHATPETKARLHALQDQFLSIVFRETR